jgi:murein DD-endopeptidase MepM/ murein hydrolase activator NlpD
MGYVTPTGKREISCTWQCHRDRPTPSSEPGTDYAGPTSGGYGSPCYAPDNGTVADVKHSNTSATGRYVKINLDDGKGTRTLHMAEVWVAVGQRVARGQQVGKVGGSANGSDRGVGNHAHQTLWPTHAYAFGSNATLDFDKYVGEIISAGYQRLVGANGANYRSEPKGASTKVDTFKPGTVTDWDGWIHGESVEGNDVWFRGRYTGGWSWSGGFTDPGTHDLEDLNPKAPTLQPNQRIAVPAGANGRKEPRRDAEFVMSVPGGGIGTFDGWIHGEEVEGNDVWIRGAGEDHAWYWIGGWEDPTTHNIPDMNPVAPPVSSNRIVGANSANVRETPWLTSPSVLSEQPNSTIIMKGYVVNAEPVQGNAVWFVREDGRYMWSGGFTSQDTAGLLLMATPPKPEPADNLDNPANLPEYTPVWAEAHKGLEAPLGFQPDGTRAPRTSKGSPPVPTTGVISYLILHHCATTVDQLYWFSTKNSRDVCPSYYFRPSGKVFELIRPGAKPATTGAQWNWRSISIEMLNSSGAPGWELTDAQREMAAHLAVRMREAVVYEGGVWDGAPIDFVIDRQHVIGHNEALPGTTECPGPDMDADWIVSRALELWAEKYPPVPEPTTAIIDREDAEEVLAAAERTAAIMRDVLGK